MEGNDNVPSDQNADYEIMVSWWKVLLISSEYLQDLKALGLWVQMHLYSQLAGKHWKDYEFW